MIFVTLGTQDKPFKRLIDYFENSDINDEIIVQAGFTEYTSNKLKIYKYIGKDDFDKYIKEADYIVCHGGVGTIVNCLENDKKVLVVPRLSKYGEHQNDHQLQIASVYGQKGYILVMNDGDDIKEKLEELKTFKPKKFISNNKIFVSKLKKYIIG